MYWTYFTSHSSFGKPYAFWYASVRLSTRFVQNSDAHLMKGFQFSSFSVTLKYSFSSSSFISVMFNNSIIFWPTSWKKMNSLSTKLKSQSYKSYTRVQACCIIPINFLISHDEFIVRNQVYEIAALLEILNMRNFSSFRDRINTKGGTEFFAHSTHCCVWSESDAAKQLAWNHNQIVRNFAMNFTKNVQQWQKLIQ